MYGSNERFSCNFFKVRQYLEDKILENYILNESSQSYLYSNIPQKFFKIRFASWNSPYGATPQFFTLIIPQLFQTRSPEWNENFTCCSKMLRSAKLKEKYEDRFQLKNSSGRSNDYVQWIVLPTSYNSKGNRLLLLPCHSCSKVSTTVNFAITRQMINAPRTKERTEKARLFVTVFAAVVIYR